MLAENRALHARKTNDPFVDDILHTKPRENLVPSSGVQPEHLGTVHLEQPLHERYPSDVSTDSDDEIKSPNAVSHFDFDPEFQPEPTPVQQDPFVENMQVAINRDSENAVQRLLQQNEKLIENGIQPSSQAIDESLKIYENFVTMSQIEREVPTLNPELDNRPRPNWWKRIVNKFLKTDTQKTTAVIERRIATKLAQNVFVLDDAASTKVVTAEQRAKISKLEVAYKKPWQRVQSWWKRLWKK